MNIGIEEKEHDDRRKKDVENRVYNYDQKSKYTTFTEATAREKTTFLHPPSMLYLLIDRRTTLNSFYLRYTSTVMKKAYTCTRIIHCLLKVHAEQK